MRWLGVVLVGAAVLAGAACGDASRGVGAGDDVDFCTGYREYDRLHEPHPDKRAEAVTYADAFQRIIDRVDRRQEFENQEKKEIKVAPEVMADLKVMRDELLDLRDELREADDDAEARGLVTAFTQNRKFREADTRVTSYYRGTCGT